MPEGHTVHRLARTFAELFGGQILEVTSPQGRFDAGARLLDGLRLQSAQAWGKHLFLGLSREDGGGSDPLDDHLLWLHVHLGLYGSWTFAGDGTDDVAHAIGAPRRRVGERESVSALPAVGADGPGPWNPPEPRGQVRVRLLGEHAVADLTGPTRCEVVTAAERDRAIARLGPDPIRADADPEAFVARVRRSRTSVGAQLMDQSVIAGVGNIYRAEALFRAELDPWTPGRDVPAETLRTLWTDLVDLMHDGVRVGAIVTTRPEDRAAPGADVPPARPVRQNTDGTPGAVPREESFYVYQRAGQSCRRCGTPVVVEDMAARKLYRCPGCQR
ncbi:endonuclease-8 [Paraoerskovia marina]|uniref:DNA-(apurinic or apyrimidinic site) lyase n=1 Tax=Paraoerskovia marina TaxID=545619 RepID=A0A1H1U8N5_9CELL|nr:DNA-formamidopyrimidine glycosylase family protein [Paraoerskovia marina]SDS68747.1 endonuclease-8 [Paraoerskovia marina]